MKMKYRAGDYIILDENSYQVEVGTIARIFAVTGLRYPYQATLINSRYNRYGMELIHLVLAEYEIKRKATKDEVLMEII